MEFTVVMLLLAGAGAGDPLPPDADKEAAAAAAPAAKQLEAPRRMTLKLSPQQTEKRGWAGPQSGTVKLRPPPSPVPLSAFVQPDGRVVYRHGRLSDTSGPTRKNAEESK